MHDVLRTSEAIVQAIKGSGSIFRNAALLAGLAISVQACSLSGKSLDDSAIGAIAIVEANSAISPDPFEKAEDAEGAERDRLLDEDTIRHAVTSADLENYSGALPWANQSTGSSGSITQIEQLKVSGQTCRRFMATRQAYDGVTLYHGDLCLDRRTGWWTRLLEPAGTSSDG